MVANANEEDNSYEQRLWLYENGAVRQLTDLGKEGRFVWLDENRLLFPAVRSAKEKKREEAHEEFTSYYVLDLRGGEALPFFTLPFAVGQHPGAGREALCRLRHGGQAPPGALRRRRGGAGQGAQAAGGGQGLRGL